VTRRQFLAGAGAAVALGVTGCGDDDGGGDGGGTGPAIRHKFGQTEIPDDPRRVVTVGLNDHDALLALGVAPVAVVDWYGDYDYAAWPWAQDALGDARPEVVGDAESIDFEAVAAARPDLVLGLYSGLREQDYATLSEIAPTVAQPADYADWGVPWPEQTRLIGQAVGRERQADELVRDIEGRFEEARAAHPELDGVTVALGALAEPGSYGVYGPQDPKVRFLTALGLVVPDEVAELAGDDNFDTISTEQLELLDHELLVWYAGGGFGDPLRTELASTPLYERLDVVQAGRTIILEDLDAEALTWSTVLSLPTAIENLTPRIAEVARR
jgi:iron complex transport system substrate-binding protein